MDDLTLDADLLTLDSDALQLDGQQEEPQQLSVPPSRPVLSAYRPANLSRAIR